MKCPYCDAPADAEFVDVGVGGGGMQVTPYCCSDCHAMQIGPYDKPRDLTEEEQRTGWYAPDPQLR